VFGLGFGEIVVLIIAAIVVIGPRELPSVLRKLGRWASQLRRMAADLRIQSGIDDVLREGNLHEDIAEIRKLARGEIHDVSLATRVSQEDYKAEPEPKSPVIEIVREREAPIEGPDVAGALPETAVVYADSFPRSEFADDPVYLASIPDPPDPDTVAEPDEVAAEAKGTGDAVAHDGTNAT
jgi:sec-independent protein translocase protein TatB